MQPTGQEADGLTGTKCFSTLYGVYQKTTGAHGRLSGVFAVKINAQYNLYCRSQELRLHTYACNISRNRNGKSSEPRMKEVGVRRRLANLT